MIRMIRDLARFKAIKSEAGVTAIEYGLIAALIAVTIIVALTAIGTNMKVIFTKISTTI